MPHRCTLARSPLFNPKIQLRNEKHNPQFDYRVFDVKCYGHFKMHSHLFTMFNLRVYRFLIAQHERRKRTQKKRTHTFTKNQNKNRKKSTFMSVLFIFNYWVCVLYQVVCSLQPRADTLSFSFSIHLHSDISRSFVLFFSSTFCYPPFNILHAYHYSFKQTSMPCN